MSDFAENDLTKGNGQDSPPKQSLIENRRPTTVRKLARLTLGGTMLVADLLTKWLPDDQPDIETPGPHQDPEQKFRRPLSEWEDRPGNRPGHILRHGLVGFLIDAQEPLQRARSVAQQAGNSVVGKAAAIALKPLQTSKAFSPVRAGFHSLAERGRMRASRWVEMGRAEEAHSRALAQTTVSQMMASSLSDLEENPHVHGFIQEVVQEQSLGMVDEIIEETRERAITGDILLERFVRSILRRAPRDTLPPPPPEVRQLARPVGQKRVSNPALLGQYGGFTSRLLAMIVDMALLTIGLTVLSWFLTGVNALFRVEGLLEAAVGAEIWLVAKSTIVLLVSFCFIAGYPIFFWTFTGQTIGKMLLGVRIVSMKGGHVSLWRAILRLVGYCLNIFLLFSGFFWVLADNRRQGFHDKLAGTCVIYAWPARPDETFLKDHLLIN